ncbi:hypothetical protein KP005_02705 [Geomonas nitrogeniifigens]|uniref:DUF4440 domain-containing protein n=1 Tax=Geomonas diazotrophica TaxID=2843197 RepID=A0ABX8JS40_9BACT|nr:hypothetical protein [Geomonas nitrogeniifigens]QWV98220.1 hypothetical protein KP005_02705 [Geomonas nitrogeniifigens]
MLRHLTVIIFFLFAFANIAEANGDTQVFWNRFREAVLSGDSERVAALTKFPLWVRGPDDSDPVVYYGRKDFDKILKRLLNQEVSTWVDGKVVVQNMREIIREKHRITPKELRTPRDLSIELLQFEKTDGKWLFTRGYLEDGAD